MGHFVPITAVGVAHHGADEPSSRWQGLGWGCSVVGRVEAARVGTGAVGADETAEVPGTSGGDGDVGLARGGGPVLREHSQLEPMAKEVHRLQEQKLPVAWMSRSRGRLHFWGRLQRPLPVLAEQELPSWRTGHRGSFLLVPFKRWPGPDQPAGARRFWGGAWRHRSGSGRAWRVPRSRCCPGAAWVKAWSSALAGPASFRSRLTRECKQISAGQ